MKYWSNGWYIVLTENGTIRAATPFNGNDILEEIDLGSGTMALRVVNYNAIVNTMTNEGSGFSLENDEGLTPEIEIEGDTPQCYIGFSSETGRATCYSNTDNVYVRLYVSPLEL